MAPTVTSSNTLRRYPPACKAPGWKRLSEGAKRRYEAHFISKLTDCDGENSETDTSLDFAHDCQYITAEQHDHLTSLCAEIGRMLGSMLRNPGSFLLKQ